MRRCPGGVDASDGAPTRADGVDVDRRHVEAVAADCEPVDDGHHAADGDGDIAGGPADLHRHQRVTLGREATGRSADSGGAREDQIDRARADGVDRHGPAIRLQHQERAGEPHRPHYQQIQDHDLPIASRAADSLESQPRLRHYHPATISRKIRLLSKLSASLAALI